MLLHREGDEEVVGCLNASTGQAVWEQRYPTSFVCGSHYTHGPYSTPATDGEMVYTLGAQGQLHCWSLIDGRLRWSRDLMQDFQVPPGIFGVGHSPLLWGDRLILNFGGQTPNSGIVAFHKLTGEVLWRSTSAGAAFATPQPARIHNRDWLFSLTLQGLSLLDPATGHEHWAIPFEPKIPDAANAVTPMISGDRVVISAWGVGTRVLRLDVDGNVTEVWDSKRVLTSQYTPLVEVDDCMIGVHALDNSLRCVDLETSELRWRWKSTLANSKPVRVGRQLILFGEYGHLGMIECRTDGIVEQCLTSAPLFAAEERCFSAPAYARGRLYVRNESEVVCLRLADH